MICSDNFSYDKDKVRYIGCGIDSSTYRGKCNAVTLSEYHWI